MWEREHFYFDLFLVLSGGALPFFYLQPSMAPTDYRDLELVPLSPICNPYYKSAK
jgi:hypothetical protein